MAEAVLRVQQVMQRFGGLVALQNINIDVYSGEIVGIIGPNGAGKTTLFISRHREVFFSPAKISLDVNHI